MNSVSCFYSALIVKFSKWLVPLLGLLFFIGCGAEKKADNPIRSYFYVGHTYDWYNPAMRIDPRLVQLDKSGFDEIWLGGDILIETTKNREYLNYVDSVFHISSPNTHWSPGNHDTRNGNLNFIEEKTGRKTYYAYYKNGITRLVLNTNYNSIQAPAIDGKCEDMAAQLALIKAVCDTIKKSSHLVVLIHHILWERIEPELKPQIASVANYNSAHWQFLCDDSSSTFDLSVYPSLKKVQKRDIQVLICAGDFGMITKKMEHTNKDGIVYLGAAVNNSVLKEPVLPNYVYSTDPDQYLIFTHDIKNKTLTWEFKQLEDWVKSK